MRTCPYCEEQIAPSVTACPFCKADLSRPVHTGPGGAAPQRRSSGNNTGLIVAVLAGVVIIGMCGVMILIALLLPAVQQAREAARRSACKNNLKQIGLALHNYHDVNGAFPPAYIADEQGNPMHSWRVLILPFLGEQPLYSQYDFSEPWDSPVNSAVLEQMPAIYRCPSEPDAVGGTTTSYAAVFGPNCIFAGSEPISMRDILDGTSNTLLVGEVHDAGIPWTKPQDIDVEIFGTLGDPDGFSSKHMGIINFLLADGAVRALSLQIDQELLNNLYERNDGNAVGAF